MFYIVNMSLIGLLGELGTKVEGLKQKAEELPDEDTSLVYAKIRVRRVEEKRFKDVISVEGKDECNRNNE